MSVLYWPSYQQWQLVWIEIRPRDFMKTRLTCLFAVRYEFRDHEKGSSASIANSPFGIAATEQESTIKKKGFRSILTNGNRA